MRPFGERRLAPKKGIGRISGASKPMLLWTGPSRSSTGYAKRPPNRVRKAFVHATTTRLMIRR